MYISFAGIIGAGKTYLATKLAEKFGTKVIEEPQLNPELFADGILKDFYSDMKRYGFMFQIYLAQARINQLRNLDGFSITDRSVYEDLIFSKMLVDDNKMEEREHILHKKILNDLLLSVEKPRVIIKINSSPEDAFNNIKSRGRSEEKNLPFEYLKHLNYYYEKYFKIFCGAKIIEIDNKKLTEDEQIEFIDDLAKKIQEYI